MKNTSININDFGQASPEQRLEKIKSLRARIVDISLAQDAKVEKKYEIVTDKDNKKVIRALRSFGNIHKGTIGGEVESEFNLAHSGTCWIYPGCSVTQNARVCDDAVIGYAVKNTRISGQAIVCGNTSVNGNILIQDDAIVIHSLLFNDDNIYQSNHDIDSDDMVVKDQSLVADCEIKGNTQIIEYATVYKCSIHNSIIKRLYVNSKCSTISQYVSFIGKRQVLEIQRGYLQVEDMNKPYEEWCQIVTNFFLKGVKYPKLRMTPNQYMTIKNLCYTLEYFYKEGDKIYKLLRQL